MIVRQRKNMKKQAPWATVLTTMNLSAPIFLTSPANGDDNEFGGTVIDKVFGPSSLIPDIPQP